MVNKQVINNKFFSLNPKREAYKKFHWGLKIFIRAPEVAENFINQEKEFDSEKF